MILLIHYPKHFNTKAVIQHIIVLSGAKYQDPTISKKVNKCKKGNISEKGKNKSLDKDI